MKGLAYFALRLWVKVGLFCYYKRIDVAGLENISQKKPVIFLSNHQNALMDVLLIATQCKRKPWFLTRSDVFVNPYLKSFFKFLQMLPIYRLRDGRHQLAKNQAIFDKCAKLLQQNQAIVLFPEANHSLKRNVRPLSKGFIRIIANALEKAPGLDIQIIPIGQNYAFPTQPGDSIVLQFGEPIQVNDCFDGAIPNKRVRDIVFWSITKLTTHIPENDYDVAIDSLGKDGEIFLYPLRVNTMVARGVYTSSNRKYKNAFGAFLKGLFMLWNLPMVLLWRLGIKPRVPEAEFTATFRFGFSLLGYSLGYTVGIVLLWMLHDLKTACLFIFGHAVFNILLVKSGITSVYQRK